MVEENYGAGDLSSLSVWEKLKLLQEWSPILTYGQRFLSESDPHQKTLVVADFAEWLASKSGTTVDDELVDHVAAVLRSPQGESLVRWVVAKIEGPK